MTGGVTQEGLPPVKELVRDHKRAYQVLYMKGPLLLYELEKIIGKEKFIELLNVTHTEDIDSTDKFLEKLGKVTNQEIEENFKKLLSM